MVDDGAALPRPTSKADRALLGRVVAVAVAVVASALALAGCSDDDEGRSAGPDAVATETGTGTGTDTDPGRRADADADADAEADTDTRQPTTSPSAEPGDPATPAGVDAAPLVEQLEWDGCDGLECATLRVPVIHGQAEGPTIDLAVARAPARGDDAIGSLVVNPGGPGISAIDYLRTFVIAAPSELAERFDLVAFDPRGVGRSAPVDCGWVLDDDVHDPLLASDDPGVRVPRALALAAADAADCVEAVDPELLVRVGTVSTARDLDLLRQALGEDDLTYLGFSYGTKIGAVYAELFGDRVRAMVLDGADRMRAEPDDVLTQYAAFEVAFDAFDAGCGATQRCAFATGEAAEVLDEVDARLRAGALPAGEGADGAPRRLSRDELYVAVLAALYDPQSWPSLAAGLELAAEDGDGAVLQQLADAYLQRRPDGTYTDALEAFVAITCADDADRPSAAEVGAVADRAAGVLDAFAFVAPEVGVGCHAWPDAVEPIAPVTGAGAPPLLVVGTTGDPATPYAWAVELADDLTSAQLLTYEGTVHTALFTSRCVREAATAYLVTTELPIVDRCRD